MSNRKNAASKEFDRFIIELQREYDLSSLEIVSLLSTKTAGISEKLLEDNSTRKISPVKNTIMKQIVALEKLGMKE